MTASTPRRPSTLFATAALAAAMAWVACASWRGLVEEPMRFTTPAFVAAALVAVTGAGLRSLRLRWYVVLPAQLAVVLVWFHHRLHVDTAGGGWLPTSHGISEAVHQVRHGAAQINYYAAPVHVERADAPVYLVAAAILVILAVDLIACGWGRVPWSGLPVIIAVTIPISVLDGGLPVPVFVITGLLFIALLATVETDHLLGWGEAVTGRRRRGDGGDGGDQILDRSSVAGPAFRIGAVTAVGALALGVLVPVTGGLPGGDGDGKGKGGSSSGSVRLTNPLVGLRRDLVTQTGTPLLDALTDSGADPTYLRIAVLDKFDGRAWKPSARNLTGTQKADGALPPPPGVGPTALGVESSWQLQTSPAFDTTWLPTPYPTRTISIDRGDWRYDPDTLDIANVDKRTPVGVGYQLSGFSAEVDPAALEAAGSPPPSVRDPMTKVPQLSAEVKQIAEQVTAAGTTPYDKAVLLQSWFRDDDRFTYSLDQRPGDGMAQLERFLTVDRVGYCEQFAAAMAVMARALRIPARVVVGFLSPSDTDTSSGPPEYHYTSDDLHAWPEIYFRGSGWIRFEPTPSARTGAAPAWTRGGVRAPVQPVPSATPSQIAPAPAPAHRPASETGGGSGGSGRSTAQVAVGAVLLLGLVLALVLPMLVRRGRRGRRLRGTADARATITDLWRELRATAVDLGVPWPEGRSVRTIADAVAHRVSPTPDQQRDLDQLVDLVERALYSARLDLSAADRDGARATAELWSRLMSESVPPRQARRARLFPRSVMMREMPVDIAGVEPIDSLTEVG